MKKLILFLLLGMFLVSLVGAECYGGVDLDINEIERIPGESFFKVIATANGNGDCLRVAWSKEDLNNLLNKESPEELINNDITGDINLISQTDKFNTHSYIKLYNYENEYGGWLGSCEDICSSKGHPISPPEGYAIRNSYIFGCYCVYKGNLIGSIGTFGSRDLSDQVKFSFSGLPETILDTSQGSVDIGGKINVAYRGSLIGTKLLEAPTDYRPFKKPDGTVILVSGSKDIAEYIITTFINCLNNAESSSKADSCIYDYSSHVDSFFSTDKILEWASNQQGIVKDSSFVGTDFIIEKNIYSTQWPQFTLTFDAEWAGVHWITGQPKVSCPEDTSFISGETTNLDFNVENIADEKGAFSLSLDCGEVSATLSKNKVLLDSGKSEVVSVQVTYSTDTNKKVKCNLEAYATRDTTKSDECSFNLEVKPLAGVSLEDINDSQEGITGEATFEPNGKSSPTGTIILIVFLVLIGGAIGYYFYTNKKKTTLKKGVKKELETKGKHCTKCGSLLKPKGKFCSKCGRRT